jgi:hypothetical protein
MSKRIGLAFATILIAAMMATSPAFAQGGCQEFGVQGVSDQARNEEGGMGGYASHFGPQGEMAGAIHTSQEEKCSGSGR